MITIPLVEFVTCVTWRGAVMGDSSKSFRLDVGLFVMVVTELWTGDLSSNVADGIVRAVECGLIGGMINGFVGLCGLLAPDFSGATTTPFWFSAAFESPRSVADDELLPSSPPSFP